MAGFDVAFRPGVLCFIGTESPPGMQGLTPGPIQQRRRFPARRTCRRARKETASGRLLCFGLYWHHGRLPRLTPLSLLASSRGQTLHCTQRARCMFTARLVQRNVRPQAVEVNCCSAQGADYLRQILGRREDPGEEVSPLGDAAGHRRNAKCGGV
jgi:hypothetical protein